ncbi:hypothetical protein ACLOJK_002493 [Asimina triloba]
MLFEQYHWKQAVKKGKGDEYEFQPLGRLLLKAAMKTFLSHEPQGRYERVSSEDAKNNNLELHGTRWTGKSVIHTTTTGVCTSPSFRQGGYVGDRLASPLPKVGLVLVLFPSQQKDALDNETCLEWKHPSTN